MKGSHKMGHSCNHYSFEQINLFMDKELPKDDLKSMAAHCRQCPACQQTIDQLTAVSNIFKSHVEQQVDAIDRSAFQETIDRHREKAQKSGFTNIFGLLGRHLYLKLGFATSLAVALLLMFNLQFSGPSAPSASVKYVDTEMNSVMIIENEKHTIIWLSET